MNLYTKQGKPPDIVFKEYSKDVIAFVNGHGSIFHTVNATCTDTKNATIEHRFGQDEGINLFNPISLRAANQINLTNSPMPNDQDYSFGLVSMQPPNFISYEELPSLESEKRFRINWDEAFGSIKDVIYVWTLGKKTIFPIANEPKQHRSLLKVVYPTNKLIFRLIVNYLYPIKGNPYICVIDPKGEETLLMQVVPVELKNEKLSFNYQSIQPSKCFKIEINNPLLGYAYEMRWISDKKVWTKSIN